MPCQCLWPWPSLGRIVRLQLNQTGAYGRNGLPGLRRGPRYVAKTRTRRNAGAELPEPFAGERGSPCTDALLPVGRTCPRWGVGGGDGPSPPVCPTLGFVSPARSGRARAERCPAAGLARPCLLFVCSAGKPSSWA